MDFDSLLKSIKAKDFKSVYLLHGEEPFFIDAIANAIQANAISEEEKDFNEMILYGRDISIAQLASEASSYPFMGDRKLILVREAQEIQDLKKKDFEAVLDRIPSSMNPKNIFVFCYKYKTYDARKSFVKEAGKVGVVFKSEKVKDWDLVKFITKLVKEKDFDISPAAANLLGAHIGNDLSRLNNELDKLAIVLQKGTLISEVHVEENIGISKEYNIFELTEAIATRNLVKAFTISDYFSKNPKGHELVVVIPNIYSLFIRMMRYHFAKDKNPDIFARSIGMHPFVAKNLIQNCRNYSPQVLARNVSILLEYDLKSKGVGNSSANSGELLREMLFQLMN